MFRSTVAKTSFAVVAAVSFVPGLPVTSLANAAGVTPSTPMPALIDSEAQSADSQLAAHLADPHPGTPEALTHPEADHATAGSQTLITGRTAAAQISAAAVGTTVLGLDVSSYQGNVNWSQVASKGGTFAYAKSTEGTYYYDSTYFSQQYNGSYAAGLIRGAYHFAIPNNSLRCGPGGLFRRPRWWLESRWSHPARDARHRI